VAGSVVASLPADQPQYLGGARHAVDEQHVEAVVGHHRVQHQAGNPVRIGDRVPLRDKRAVGRSVQADLVHAERLAYQVEAGDGVRGGEEPPVLPDCLGAGRDRAGRRNREVGVTDAVLQRGAAQRALPGAAPADEDHAVVPQHRRVEAAGDVGGKWPARLTGAADQPDQHPARTSELSPTATRSVSRPSVLGPDSNPSSSGTSRLPQLKAMSAGTFGTTPGRVGADVTELGLGARVHIGQRRPAGGGPAPGQPGDQHGRGGPAPRAVGPGTRADAQLGES
jgi:hypothetical protein